MYDYAHPISDALEGITHSVCTLEFEDHRPLYDWTIANLPLAYRPRQIEFARLNLTYTLMSKRKLLQLVEEKLVSGWNDPRMPSLSGLRRRGYTPEAIRAFAERIGVAKNDSIVDVGLLEFAIREDLEKRAPRAMAVLRPLRVVIDNFPEGQVEWFEAANHPDDPAMGTRKIPFSKVVYIERDDFCEVPPKKWFRLSPGAEIRLPDQMREPGQECRGRDRGTALHVGSGLTRGRRARRPAGQGHFALGFRCARQAGDRAPV
jgi:glutaminyl-tRNA synthetase